MRICIDYASAFEARDEYERVVVPAILLAMEAFLAKIILGKEIMKYHV